MILLSVSCFIWGFITATAILIGAAVFGLWILNTPYSKYSNEEDENEDGGLYW